MTIQEVIAKGSEITNQDINLFGGHSIYTLVAILSIVVLVTVSGWDELKTKGKRLGVLGAMVGYIFAFNLIVIFIYHANIIEEREVNIQKWKEEVAMPYIESLEVSRYEVREISDDFDSYQSSNFDTWHTPSYPAEQGLKALQLMYVDDNNRVKEISEYFDVKLTEEKVEYLEYKKLTKDLGHGVEKGAYNLTLYVPKDFKFYEEEKDVD